MIVIGIDPGAANTGFGVVRTINDRMVALDGGVIETSPELPAEERLAKIHDSLAQLIEWHEPCLLYTSPSPRDGLLSRMPSSA